MERYVCCIQAIRHQTDYSRKPRASSFTRAMSACEVKRSSTRLRRYLTAAWSIAFVPTANRQGPRVAVEALATDRCVRLIKVHIGKIDPDVKEKPPCQWVLREWPLRGRIG